MKRDDLNETLTDIALLKPDWDQNDFRVEGLKHKRGPSRWGKTDLEFGPQEDYEVTVLGSGNHVFWARSEAALEWAYATFPEGSPRYGATGFVIDRMAEVIMRVAERDGLMSLEEFEQAMNEREQQSQQGVEE